MPIKGVTSVIRLPRLRKLSPGIKKENENGVVYPSPTDYFSRPGEMARFFDR